MSAYRQSFLRHGRREEWVKIAQIKLGSKSKKGRASEVLASTLPGTFPRELRQHCHESKMRPAPPRECYSQAHATSLYSHAEFSKSGSDGCLEYLISFYCHCHWFLLASLQRSFLNADL